MPFGLLLDLWECHKQYNGISKPKREMFIDDIKHGYHVLERTLMLCIGAWEGEQNSLSANMLKGVCRMVVAYGDSMRDDMFVEKVGRFSAKDISRTAKERRAGSLGYAEAMLLAYNRKMRYPLRWGKLYNKKGTEDMGPDVETDMEPEDSEDD